MGGRLTTDRVVCIIPARGGSKRFPRKNIAHLKGKPLLAYSIDAAVQSGVFHTICVSSEDDEILSIAAAYRDVKAMKRPDSLASDVVQVKDVCVHVLHELKRDGLSFDYFGLMLPTNPLRIGADIRNAYTSLKERKSDFLMSLVQFSHPPQRAVAIDGGLVRPYWGAKYMVRTQALEPLYRHDGSIIFGKTSVFLRTRKLYTRNVAAFVMPPERSVDIDTASDLLWAQFLLSQAAETAAHRGQP